jgi:hypothetical protein
MSEDELTDLATRAYLYAFPLVFNLDQVVRFTEHGIGQVPAGPFNTWSHARELAGPDATFVSINNDTVYSMAQLDLGVGPVLIDVPDTAGRYYVLQFVDAWTNNFAYVGHRATGTASGSYLVVPPGWTDEVSDGLTRIEAPTRIVSIVGRFACTGVDDLPAVHALQDQLVLAQLDPAAVPAGLPVPDSACPEQLAFWERFRVWSQDLPPAPRDESLQASFAQLLTAAAGPTPYADVDPAVSTALVAGAAGGTDLLDSLLKSGGGSQQVNGWALTYHVFDYNLDYFEVGALDEDAFKIADPMVRIGTRAAAAKAGLWGNHAYEAAYVMTYVDDRDEPLTGEHTYTLRLDPPPPVDAFWSITMYDLPEFYLVANPIGRYSVGDRTPGIVYDDDGALVITMSRTEPTEPTARANWLPTPADGFRPILRMYEPGEAVLDGSYVLPPITRS